MSSTTSNSPGGCCCETVFYLDLYYSTKLGISGVGGGGSYPGNSGNFVRGPAITTELVQEGSGLLDYNVPESTNWSILPIDGIIYETERTLCAGGPSKEIVWSLEQRYSPTIPNPQISDRRYNLVAYDVTAAKQLAIFFLGPVGTVPFHPSGGILRYTTEISAPKPGKTGASDTEMGYWSFEGSNPSGNGLSIYRTDGTTTFYGNVSPSLSDGIGFIDNTIDVLAPRAWPKCAGVHCTNNGATYDGEFYIGDASRAAGGGTNWWPEVSNKIVVKSVSGPYRSEFGVKQIGWLSFDWKNGHWAGVLRYQTPELHQVLMIDGIEVEHLIFPNSPNPIQPHIRVGHVAHPHETLDGSFVTCGGTRWTVRPSATTAGQFSGAEGWIYRDGVKIWTSPGNFPFDGFCSSDRWLYMFADRVRIADMPGVVLESIGPNSTNDFFAVRHDGSESVPCQPTMNLQTLYRDCVHNSRLLENVPPAENFKGSFVSAT